MSETKGRFLTGSTMGHVIRMTMTGAVGITFVFLVDAANLFWIAQLGEPRLMAAIGFAFAIQFMSISVNIGLMIASTALVSRHIGAGNRAMARRVATSAATLAVSAQVLIALGILIWRHDLVAMAGAEGETARLAARYLAITMPTLPLMAISMIANGTLRAQGDGKRSMYITLLSGGVAMVVDPLLIYGLEMGLDGAAAGLILSRFIMLGMALKYAVGLHDLMAKPSLHDIRETLRPYMTIAIPAILTQLATPTGNYILTTVMAPFGDEAMAGWAVVGRLTVVAFGGIFALSGAIGGIFGQNFGARQMDRLKTTYRDSLIFCIAYTLVVWAALAVSADLVAGVFELGPEAADILRSYTYIGAGAFLFIGANYVSNAAFNSLGKPVRSTITNWLRDGAMTLPAALLFAGWFGAPGVVYAQAAAGATVGVFACLWGWHYVSALARSTLPKLDLDPPRPYANADRYRRR